MRKRDENKQNSPGPTAVKVKIEKGKADKTEFRFTKHFRVGRDPSCEVHLSDPEASRFHAEIWFAGDKWWVLDLQSANGVYVDGKKLERAELAQNTRIDLGIRGPRLSLTIEETSPAAETPQDHFSLADYKKRYFGDSADDDVGTRTMMIRQAFKQVQKRQKRKYAWIIGAFACLFLAAGTYAVFKHMEVRKQRLLAEDIFYAMKSLEVEFAGFLKTARSSEDGQSIERVNKYRTRRKEMQESYDQFLDSLKVYGDKLNQEERTIMRMARTFGECEINMPAGFIKEVMAYVKKWQSSARLEKALTKARRKKYVTGIAETMLSHDLPPQFLYLALQESNFDLNAVGPDTNFGIAKGMWQFIPSTAGFYGLQTGPLLHIRRPDPRDERHDFEKSTKAAATYLRDIYDTEAQASGLLVIASYNWGERRVNKLLRTMPENPRERNFWRLLAGYKKRIPNQTYDYVFLIFSAAVIGENPRLFGFEFDNPLAQIADRS